MIMNSSLICSFTSQTAGCASSCPRLELSSVTNKYVQLHNGDLIAKLIPLMRIDLKMVLQEHECSVKKASSGKTIFTG